MTTETQKQIETVCDKIKNLLISKNKKYGDSALNPTRVFSKSNAVEQLLVRIDDKLSRISKGAGILGSDEDVIDDLIGYLVLLKIALSRESFKNWDGSDIVEFLSLRDNIGDNQINEDESYREIHASGDHFS
jgi:hypothetical protein